MRNLKDNKSKIFPSTTKGGKELPSSSALDSPSVLSKLVTPPPAIHSDMSQVINDATSTMHDAYDDTTALLDNTVPLGEFLDEQLAGAKDIENAETDDISETEHFETPAIPSSPRYELPVRPEGYVMDGEVARDFLACKDRDDLKNYYASGKKNL
jgi:hypothetical protein